MSGNKTVTIAQNAPQNPWLSVNFSTELDQSQPTAYQVGPYPPASSDWTPIVQSCSALAINYVTSGIANLRGFVPLSDQAKQNIGDLLINALEPALQVQQAIDKLGGQNVPSMEAFLALIEQKWASGMKAYFGTDVHSYGFFVDATGAHVYDPNNPDQAYDFANSQNLCDFLRQESKSSGQFTTFVLAF